VRRAPISASRARVRFDARPGRHVCPRYAPAARHARAP
jgi:hypothetical protein